MGAARRSARLRAIPRAVDDRARLSAALFDADEDRFEGDLVERDLTGENALLCDTLGVYWCVKSDLERGQVLRLARDPLGKELLSTPEERQRAAMDREHAATEQERLAKEQERLAKEQERLAKEQERLAKEAALARVAELEAELGRRGER